MLGGFMGFGIQKAMRYGFARGVFSNEAGLGSSPIAHAASTEKEPVKQGLWGVFEVFLDTFVICTLTALLVLTANLGGTKGADVALQSFMSVGRIFSKICEYSFSIILPLFAFSTILAWAVYGGKACQYVFGKKSSVAVQYRVHFNDYRNGAFNFLCGRQSWAATLYGS